MNPFNRESGFLFGDRIVRFEWFYFNFSSTILGVVIKQKEGPLDLCLEDAIEVVYRIYVPYDDDKQVRIFFQTSDKLVEVLFKAYRMSKLPARFTIRDIECVPFNGTAEQLHLLYRG